MIETVSGEGNANQKEHGDDEDRALKANRDCGRW